MKINLDEKSGNKQVSDGASTTQIQIGYKGLIFIVLVAALLWMIT